MHERVYLAYIVASKSRTLYVGVTNDLLRRVLEHKQKKHAGFSARYNCNRLVWFQRFSEVSESIQREKELKGWGRDKKTSLIESANSTWEDLSQDWYPNLSTYLPTHPHPCHPESPRLLGVPNDGSSSVG